jgi:hypothetical protein
VCMERILRNAWERLPNLPCSLNLAPWTIIYLSL